MAPHRGYDWLAQAEDDLEWALDTIKNGRFAAACFVCQQSAEKAVKGLALARGVSEIRSHAVATIAKALTMPEEVIEHARFVDRFYISARYPDAYPEGYPSQYLGERDATEALSSAKAIVDYCRTAISSII